MIVADTSALISLATADSLGQILEEFEVHTTRIVVDELEETAGYDDRHGIAARAVLDRRERMAVHEVPADVITSSRIDAGEGSCCALSAELGADFLITDDLRALPELHRLTESQVAISPIVLKALVKLGALEREEAIDRLDELAKARDWLGAPIYRRAYRLFED